MAKILWFLLLKCEFLLVVFVLYDSEQNNPQTHSTIWIRCLHDSVLTYDDILWPGDLNHTSWKSCQICVCSLIYASSLTYLITFEASNNHLSLLLTYTEPDRAENNNSLNYLTEHLPKSWKSLCHNRCLTCPRCEPTGHWRGGVCRGRGGLCEAVCVVRIPPAGSGCRGAACEAAPRLRGRACSPGPPTPALCLDWSASWWELCQSPPRWTLLWALPPVCSLRGKKNT